MRTGRYRLGQFETAVVLAIALAALAIAGFAYSSIGQIQQALAQEVLEQQRGIAALHYRHIRLLGALQTAAADPERLTAAAVKTALTAARRGLDSMRQYYSFSQLDGAATAHALVKPALADVERWQQSGLPGYRPDSAIVLRVATQRVADNHPQLAVAVARTEHQASALIADQGKRLGRFRTALIVLLAGFAAAALATILLFLRQRNAQARLGRELAHRASHDALTGLVNRNEFERRLRRAIADARAGGRHALCYMDLDQFKIVNDSCGHAAGDELLRQLAAVFRRQIRRQDSLGRLGGDEFAVLLEHCPEEQALRIANALRRTVEEFRFGWRDQSFAVGVSVGLVPIGGGAPPGDVGQVLRAADSACYVAKDAGRNRVHVYRPNDAELARHHGELRWVRQINHALEHDRFTLFAQPIVALDGRQVSHYELLLRMLDDAGEAIPPGAFLPAAERYNLAVRIDRWVVTAAFAAFTARPGWLRQVRLCAINLSGASLSDAEFLDFLLEQLDHSAISADQLCFEITETAAIANLTAAVEFIETLKRRGCRFALDDFGSGLSSFAYLKNLPVDFLKIDGLFVRDIADDPIDLAMVRSINEIGQLLGKQTVAEFAENDAVLAELGRLQVDYAQGYGIGRPRPLAELTDADAAMPLSA